MKTINREVLRGRQDLQDDPGAGFAPMGAGCAVSNGALFAPTLEVYLMRVANVARRNKPRLARAAGLVRGSLRSHLNQRFTIG